VYTNRIRGLIRDIKKRGGKHGCFINNRHHSGYLVVHGLGNRLGEKSLFRSKAGAYLAGSSRDNTGSVATEGGTAPVLSDCGGKRNLSALRG
jgi:hypothetical protein